MENPQFWWYLLGKMGIFMGYVSFRECTSKVLSKFYGICTAMVKSSVSSYESTVWLELLGEECKKLWSSGIPSLQLTYPVSPENRPFAPKKKWIIFQLSIFRDDVCFREGTSIYREHLCIYIYVAIQNQILYTLQVTKIFPTQFSRWFSFSQGGIC